MTAVSVTLAFTSKAHQRMHKPSKKRQTKCINESKKRHVNKPTKECINYQSKDRINKATEECIKRIKAKTESNKTKNAYINSAYSAKTEATNEVVN